MALANVVHPEQLKFFPSLVEMVQLSGTALTDLQAAIASGDCYKYRALDASGDYPAAVTDRVRGVINYISETEAPEIYASVITEGIAIIEVEPGETIVEDGPVTVNASGKAVAAVATNEVLGYARNASAGSTVSVPHYIEVKINQYLF